MSHTSPLKSLDLTREGLDPSDVEAWRRSVFAVILSGRGGTAFAGASLAYDRGTIDFEIMKDADCPENMTAVMANTTFLGMRFAAPLTKDQVYLYTDQWIAAGRPNQYLWPPQNGQPPLAPVEIMGNDPCRSVKPRETLTAAQRQRMTQEGRSGEWKHYKRTMDGAFAVLQAHMSEAMNFSMNQLGAYTLAMSSGDLLEGLSRIKVKAICGTRPLAKVISKAVRNVIEPKETGHHQREGESEESYTARFKKAVDAAHGLRILGETVAPLSESDCIRGLLNGLRKGFDAEKAHWLLDVLAYGGLEASIERVKQLAEHVPKPEVETTPADNPTSENSSPVNKRKLEATNNNDGEAPRQRFRYRRPFQTGSAYSTGSSHAPGAGYARNANGTPGQIFLTGGSAEADDFEEDMYTAEQVQQLIDEAVQDKAIFTTQSVDTRGYASPPWQQYQQPYQQYYQQPQVFQVAAFGQPPQYPVRTGFPCRNFTATGQCSYGNNCKFAHVAASTAPPTATSAPARVNPFAARPN